MKNVAFLSMDSLNGFECYDRLLFEPLRQLGWSAEEVSWRSEKDWNYYDAVIVRSAWDYQNDPKNFFNTLERINISSHLENNLPLMQWNLNKRYLRDLEEKEIKIVPTIFEKNLVPQNLTGYFERLNFEEIIIKPCISANADNTFRIKRSGGEKYNGLLHEVFKERDFLVQPFMSKIVDEGEYSLFYFGGEYSHTILKKPKENDFRVQEEHGGKLILVEPFRELKAAAEKILDKISEIPLYARIDLVRDGQNDFALMELELIEPSLYFNMDKNSPRRFAEIFDSWMKKN